ncbi:MAG: AAA family ATPase [Gammaproteobacteria bacterium]|nr:AAA family ATPase [Gammaproteobacteria bacterium]
MPGSALQTQITIGDRLKTLKQQLFVNRYTECEIFTTALTAVRDWQILNVWGAAGIGKSSLLDAFRRIAETERVFYLYFDCRDIFGTQSIFVEKLASGLQDSAPLTDRSLTACFDALHHIALSQPLVLVLDTFDEIGELNRWLRESVLSHLPQRSLIVIASRYSLENRWRDYSGWRQLIHSLPLGSLDFASTRQYLGLYGVDDDNLIQQAWHYTEGHPLALSLASALVSREGQAAISIIPKRPDVLDTLASRWLSEISQASMRDIVEAAAVVRRFNQDLLSQMVGRTITTDEFENLLLTSFVRHSQGGWSLHELVRDALSRALKGRSPSTYNLLRARAVNYFATVAALPGELKQRNTALHEFFYLVGDGLVRAALYDESPTPGSTLYFESAIETDLDDLNGYMAEWRQTRDNLNGHRLQLYDRDNQDTIEQWIVSEPREPDFIDTRLIVRNLPGTMRLLRDQDRALRGLSIVFPITAETLPFLEQQPVTRHYFSQLNAAQRAEYIIHDTPINNWFVRLADVRNPTDKEARSILFRELVGLLIRPARFITSTPLPFYQELLMRFGFERADLEAHTDFGTDRPSPYFVLDLRGTRLSAYLQQLINHQFGANTQLPFDPDLAGAVARQISTPNDQPANAMDHPLLKPLTEREREVALAATEGLPNCSIAARLNVSEITVKKHMSRIYEKLGIRNRSELIKAFWRSTASH